MCFTTDQIDRACGLLLLTEFNTFIYCCKRCQSEFDSGPDLEVHILSQHRDNKELDFESVNALTSSISDGPTVIDFEPTNVKTEQFDNDAGMIDERSVDEPYEDFVLTASEFFNDSNDANESTYKERPQVTVTLEEAKVLVQKVDHNTIETAHGPLIAKKQCRGRPPGTKNGTKSKQTKNDKIKETIRATGKRSVGRPKSTAPKVCAAKVEAFYCDMCPEWKVKSKQGLLKHMTKRHIRKDIAEKMKKCEICNKYPRYSYNHHMEVYHSKSTARRVRATKNETFYCDMCPESKFKYKQGLLQHMTKRHIHTDIATNIEPFYCDMCPELKFKFKQGLLRHMTNRHIRKDIAEKMKKCEICNKYPRFSYDYHMKVYHSNIQYKCEICSAEFTQKTSYRIHLRRHTGEKPFLCSVCGKAFITKTLCSAHESSVHDGVRKFKCNYCDRSVYSRWALKNHIKAAHTKERPFVCDVANCNKDFVTNNALKLHKASHDGPKIKCRYCETVFKFETSRWRHEMVFHKKVIMVDGKFMNVYKKEHREKLKMLKMMDNQQQELD